MGQTSANDFFKKQWYLGWIIASVLLIGLLAVIFILTRTPKDQATASSDETPPPSETTSAPPTETASPEPTDALPTETVVPAMPTSEPDSAVLEIGSTRVSEIDGMEQVFVPAGEFLMGTDDPSAKRTISGGRAYPEIPQFTYYLDDYWIDKYEVTNAQYRACIEAGACTTQHLNSSFTRPEYQNNPTYDNYPAVWVSWFQASAYCEWVGRRLPTEAEWEKAARGTDGRMYPWGNDPITADKLNFCDENCPRPHALEGYDDGYVDIAPVGSYPAGASPYGVMDMAGNVWEWTSTEIRDYPYDANDGREIQTGDGERVWRGGSWGNGLWWFRSSLRYRSMNWYSWYVLGFRCASNP